MKVQELRIGNKVYFHSENIKNSEAVVLGIEDDNVVKFKATIIHDESDENTVSISQNSMEGFANIEQFEPIPLTEGWLVNFGFEKIAEYQFIKGKYKVEETIEDGVYSFRMQFTKNESWMLRYINCVHDLQNLFFCLCGEELKIK